MSTTAALPALDNFLGSMLIGVIVSAVLYGVTLLQAFFYFRSYVKDHWYTKALVTVMVVFDTIHLILISHSIYYYLVTNYFNPATLALMVWSLLLEALFTTLSGAGVQLFYTTRVWKLSKKNIPLTAFISAIVLANAGCGIAWTTLALQYKTFENLLKISNLTVTINALSMSTDVVIAVTLCFMLNRARTGFKRSDTIISRLIIFVVNTGVLTSLCAIASLVSVLASPNTLIYASFYFCIGRLYVNSLLATLNARRFINDHGPNDTSHMMVSLPPSVINNNSNNKSGSNTYGNGVESRTLAGRPTTGTNISIRMDITQESKLEEGHTTSVTDAGSEKDLYGKKTFAF